MIAERDHEAGIAWAGEVVGGKLVNRERQRRWRPQWILEFDVGGARKRVMLRGFRNPGYTDIDEGSARAFLRQEAGVLKALQGTPVKLPRYYGHNDAHGWMLMEFVEGDTELTILNDAGRRFEIYTGYVEQLAQLHAYPLQQLDLPASLFRPASCRNFKQTLLDRHLAFYRSLSRKHPEPSLELGLQWVIHNELPDERPVCVGFGDVGPNQFLFKGNDVTALIDIEYASICDPLMEMGMMRGRDVTYHTGRMPEHIRHYGQCYEKFTGIPLSMKALQYWTIAGPALWNVFTAAGTQTPNPTMVDMAFLFAYEVQQKRCILEGLAEQHGLLLSQPEQAVAKSTTLDRLHGLLLAQLDQHYRPKAANADDATFIKYTEAIARTLAQGDRSHLEHEQANLDELSAVLGHRVDDLEAGMTILEQEIVRDHMKDFERRLNFLYRFEVRRDRLYAPMQIASGVSVGHPMARMSG